MKTLSIILLTHNRPLQAYEAIQSIALQDNKNFKLIISDNSSDSSLKDVLSQHTFNNNQINFDYRKRNKVYSAYDHFNLCLNEVDTDFFCLFHDDDLMLSNFVGNFWEALSSYPALIACGMNAQLDRGDGSKKLFFQHYLKYIGPISPKNLAERYFGRYQLGIAPYPSYIYKKSVMNGMSFDINNGKYGDLIWLIEMASRGQMIWVNIPSMIYCLHDGNDSLKESRKDRLKFLAYLKRNKENLGIKILSDYRFFLYKKNLPKLHLLTKYKLRASLLKEYMQFYRAMRWFRLDHYYQLLCKFLIRQVIRLNSLVRYK